MPSIDVFWTGPDIVSREITAEHVGDIASILRRPPIIWDNLFANDYDGHRFFCGPYAGRPHALRTATRGLLLNPNNELPLNYVPLHTFSAFLSDDGGAQDAYEPRAAYLTAMREWAGWFDTITGPIPLDDVILLGDCYYLPYEDGPEADAFYQQARALISRIARSGSRAEAEARPKPKVKASVPNTRRTRRHASASGPGISGSCASGWRICGGGHCFTRSAAACGI